MSNHDVMGFIVTGGENSKLSQLITRRSIASIPIGGKYRLIDFVLSNMVNSKITNIAITTQYQFRSLMDHLGSGKEWGLDRKKDGLFIFPPFLSQNSNWYLGTADAIYRNLTHIRKSTQEYVVLAPDDSICKVEFDDVVEKHIETKADITIMYKKVSYVDLKMLGILEVDGQKTITSFEQYPEYPKTNLASMGIYVMSRKFLLDIMENYGKNARDFVWDIIIKNLNNLSVKGYEFKYYWKPINDIQAYYECNMDLINPEVSMRLFRSNGPVYTKVKDYAPAILGPKACVNHSIVPEGCNINGEIMNSVLFRGVIVEEGAKIINSIIMQDCVVKSDAVIVNSIIDKGITVDRGVVFEGSSQYSPLIIQA